jgi:heme/copper-type cytochrome/quinol oxidase subunit 3
MAHAPAAPTGTEHDEHAPAESVTPVRHPPVSPGKVAMWLFLATEVMFFTGLIGSYIVLRAGSPPSAYSNLFAPGTDLTRLAGSKGVPTGHFRPSVSLFASCFFTMTGFHGAHVAGGVIMLTCMLIGQLLGRFSPSHYSPVELVGLYWHFVDLVWIILFTVVYLI